MLYYLRQEVIGDQAEKILEGADSRLVQAHICSGPPRAGPGGRETLHGLWLEPSQTYQEFTSVLSLMRARVRPLGVGMG